MQVTLLGEDKGDGLALRLDGEGRARYIDHRRGRSQTIAFDPGHWRFVLVQVRGGGLRLRRRMVFDRRRRECAKAAREIGVSSLRDVTDLPEVLPHLRGKLRGRVRHVVTENHRVQAAVGLLKAGAVEQLGGLLTASHISLRDHYEVSTRELDVAFDAAGRAGAVGARMSGTGGSLVAFTAVERVDSVRATLLNP